MDTEIIENLFLLVRILILKGPPLYLPLFKVEPQALEYNRSETFNIDLFRKLGDEGMGILGLTAPEEYGGTEMDAAAVCLVHEELSYSDPAFCLSYLAHR